jgi:hypothetical protein
MGAAMSRRARQSGQSLVEFLVAGIVIVPLFILLPLLGKYHDIKQSSISASRKLAFECTVRYEDCASLNNNPAFADEIRTRFFAGNGEPVLSNDRPRANLLANTDGNPLWTDRGGRPLLERYGDVGIRTDARTIDPGVSSAANLLGGVGPRGFGLDLERGTFDARVQVVLSRQNGGTSFLDQLDSLALTMQFHTAILTNAWNARGPGERSDDCNPGRNTVVGRATEMSMCYGIFPTMDAAYEPFRAVITPLATFESANISDFEFHEFFDRGFAEAVPMNDTVGYPRLETRQ